MRPEGLFCIGTMAIKKNTELDYMERATDGEVQAAYVTDSDFVITESHTGIGGDSTRIGDSGDSESYPAQGFQLSAEKTITGIGLKFVATSNSPTGQVTLRIETNNAGQPSGTLANANATVNFTPTQNAWNTVLFTNTFSLSASTAYWIRLSCAAQSTNNCWNLEADTSHSYANGGFGRYLDTVWQDQSGTFDIPFRVYENTYNLQSYSEATIKTQGSYSLKGVATTGALNKTLTRTGSTINLSHKSLIKYDIYASRTGSNIRLTFTDDGSATISTIAIVTAPNTWEKNTIDISGVADADKNVINTSEIKVINADASNTFYIDNIRAR